MFELPALMASAHVRTGPSQWWSEGVATFGLLLTILHPDNIYAFIAAQFVGATAAVISARWLSPPGSNASRQSGLRSNNPLTSIPYFYNL
jgi:hypothetical protein